MVFIILGAIIGLIGGIVYALNECYDFLEGIGTTFLITILGALIGFLITIFSSILAECCSDKTWSTVEDNDIYALQDNLTTEGSFFLGSGHINDELKYFYVKETDVGYTVCNVDADKSYIRYTSDRCHIERQTCTFTNDFVAAIAFPFNDTRYIFHIPDGSILNNYAVDLK
jgi:hypothetical protein